MKKKHIGSNFDDFLKEEFILDHSSAVAVKRVIAWQIEHEMMKTKPSSISASPESIDAYSSK